MEQAVVIQSDCDLLKDELVSLRKKVSEAQDILDNLRQGRIDALVIGNRLHTINSTEHIYKIFVETMSEGAVSLSRENLVLYSNKRFSEFLKVPAEKILNTSILDYCPDEYKPRLSNMLAEGLKGECKGNLRFVSAEGSLIPVNISISPAKDENIALSIIVTNLTMLDHTVDALQEEVAERIAAEEQVRQRTEIAERRSEQLSKLTLELTQAEQRERRRFAQLVHDHIQQLLAAAKMKVGMLKSQMQDKSANQCLGQVHDLLHQSISATRSLAVQLSPPCLYETGLTKAMEWLCDWMHQKHGLKIEMTSTDGFKDICEEIRVLLFQAARELLFNVSKHAGVNECKLDLLRADDQIVICVSDQGAGFDANAVCSRNSRKLDGFGLFSIRERLEYIGGCVDIKSGTGKGTIVCVFAPLVFKKQDCQIEITENPTQDPTGWLWKE